VRGGQDGLGDGRIARRAPRALAFGTPGRAFAGFWWGGQDRESQEKCRKPASDPFGSEFSGRLGTVPGERVVAGQGAGETHLGVGQDNEPRPAVRLRGVAHAWQRPIQGLFQESERMLHIEAAHVGAPGAIQVRDGVVILGCMPPEPKRLGLARLLGQTADLDQEERPADDRASAARIAQGMLAMCFGVQSGPRPHAHRAILSVLTDSPVSGANAAM
jgi:hypothetical protein